MSVAKLRKNDILWASPSWSMPWGPMLLISLLISACNPFVAKRGDEGQACFEDGSCSDGLSCIDDTCLVLPDCTLPQTYDCNQPGAAFQGLDGDQDGSGICCDCDDRNPAIYPDAPEQCDGQDNDCDEQTDEGDVCPECIDLDQDGFGSQCPAGDDCDDSDPLAHPGATEVCDGVDQDCDGYTDELLPPIDCPFQDGVCQGAQQICQGTSGWSECDYGLDYSQEPELSCDHLDNDCDGQTDEDVDRTVAEIGAMATDNLDNNCNGLVDEPGGLVVEFPLYPGVWVDAYEITVFENADCTGQSYGQTENDYPAQWPVEDPATIELYACSLPGLIPSGHLSWYQAKRACEAQGKRLCTDIEYSAVCNNGQSNKYPYGMAFVPGVCNDPFEGAGQVEATGTRSQCTSGNGTYDMSGNLIEWLADESNEISGRYMTAGYSYSDQMCVDGEDCIQYSEWSDSQIDRLLEFLRCIRIDDRRSRFLPHINLAWLGARCCYDHP